MACNFQSRRPEIEAARVRLAVKKIDVVLTDEEAGNVDRIRAVGRVVIGSRDRRARRRAQRTSQGIAQPKREALAAFRVGVVDDRDRDGPGSLPSGEAHRAERGEIVTTRRGDAVIDVAVVRAGGIAGGVVDSGHA